MPSFAYRKQLNEVNVMFYEILLSEAMDVAMTMLLIGTFCWGIYVMLYSPIDSNENKPDAGK
jgi:hypothetical protein